MYENIILKADVATVIHKLRFVNVSWGIVHFLSSNHDCSTEFSQLYFHNIATKRPLGRSENITWCLFRTIICHCITLL